MPINSQRYPEWENHIATLDAEQRKDPFSVIVMICDHDNLFGIRERLFDYFKAAMGGELPEVEDGLGRANWIWFHKLIEYLFEAAFLIQAMRLDGRLTYIIKQNDP